jgi:hypothetical protein
MLPVDAGSIDLPVWVDHVGAQQTRWRRYLIEDLEHAIVKRPDKERFTSILDPRPM